MRARQRNSCLVEAAALVGRGCRVTALERVFKIELQKEVSQPEKLKEEIERSIRDVIKMRGEVQFVTKGSIPEEAKKIEDHRTWE